jgi:NAD/NADP transhydrogenase beta subunit
MNRSIAHVLIGGFGDGAGSKAKKAQKAQKAEGTVTEVSPEDVVEMMTEAKSIIIAPGYGELQRINASLLTFSNLTDVH